MAKKKFQEIIEQKKKENMEKKSTTTSNSSRDFRISLEGRINSIKTSMLRGYKVPKRFKNKTFDNYDIDKGSKKSYEIVKEYSEKFDEHLKNGTWLVLAGGYGLGKTHLALAAGRKAIDFFAKDYAEGTRSTVYSGRPKVQFISSSEMVQSIRDSYDSDQLDERELMNGYKKAKLLIIDDLGTEKSSEWQKEKMYLILNYRYNEMLPTIITTNLKGSELTQQLSARVVERMIEATKKGKYMLSFKGKSYRRRDNNE
jgi:DNA replication protein DnaC